MSMLTGMPLDKRFYAETGRYVGRCSSCEAAMHMECFLGSRLSDRKAEQVLRFVPLRARTVRGQPTSYYLCRACERRIDSQVFEQAVRTYESAKRYDDLADLYEAFGYLDLATMARKRTSPRKAGELDLGAIIELLGESDRKAEYKCPSCGKLIQVDGRTEADRLRFCGRCGQGLDEERLKEYLLASLV